MAYCYAGIAKPCLINIVDSLQQTEACGMMLAYSVKMCGVI